MSKKIKCNILRGCFLTLLSASAIYASSTAYPSDNTASAAEHASTPSAMAIAATTVSGAPARDYYVSPQGNDTNPGTMNAPLASIQKAIELVEPGGTVFLLEGSYYQTVSIAKSGSPAQGYITLRNAEGQTAILDGTGRQQADSAISIDNASYVRVEGLEISHYRTDSAATTPIGIRVSGSGSNIEMVRNRIHDMGTDAGLGEGGGNAHGIAVYGNAAKPLQHLAIIQNELYNLKLGASEAMAINGNVDGFRILQNTVHDNNNIGIDVIGFEGTAPNPAHDQARNGMIAENRVYNISSFGNPAYGDEYSAAGIYVDGGKAVTIMNNDIHDNDYGIELASEHAGGMTSKVEVSRNRIYHNRAAGITLGGYDENRGGTEDCIIKENELIENNSKHLGYGEINFAFDTRNNELRNNNIRANEDGLMITNEFVQNTGNTVDFNHYISKEHAHWIWKGEAFDNFSIYQAQTGNDLHSDLSIISSDNVGVPTPIEPLLRANPNNLTVQRGTAKSTIVTVTCSDTTTAQILPSDIEWTSANTGIAQVSKAGVVKGIANGSTVVTATYGGRHVDILISVIERSSGSSNGSTITTTPAPAPTPAEPTVQIKPEKTPTIDIFQSDVVKADTRVIKNIQSKVEEANTSPTPVQEPTDVKGHWAEKTMESFLKMNFIQGYEDGTVKPNQEITRAEFVSILSRIFPVSGTKQVTLNDVSHHWAYEAIDQFAAAGVIGGYGDGTFQPNKPISREEIVIILSRIVNMNGVSLDKSKGNFADLNDSYAADAMKTAAEAGIISGRNDGKFDPKVNSTRAEALTVIRNALNLNPEIKNLLESLD